MRYISAKLPSCFPIQRDLGPTKIDTESGKNVYAAKIVSMIRKYHNHKLQTNTWYREEEPHNNHETPGRQTKQSSQLSLPDQDDCKTRMDTK